MLFLLVRTANLMIFSLVHMTLATWLAIYFLRAGGGGGEELYPLVGILSLGSAYYNILPETVVLWLGSLWLSVSSCFLIWSM